ncbi:Non-classical export protein 1 [Sesbania bispinosa]|nr:Non-classical export protein 1 [Sesbania bispinosa]
MEAIQSWVSKHKLATVGSPMKPSLRLIHARLHAQALTLAVLTGAAAYHYYENRVGEPKPVVESPASSMAEVVEWELLSPF